MRPRRVRARIRLTASVMSMFARACVRAPPTGRTGRRRRGRLAPRGCDVPHWRLVEHLGVPPGRAASWWLYLKTTACCRTLPRTPTLPSSTTHTYTRIWSATASWRGGVHPLARSVPLNAPLGRAGCASTARVALGLPFLPACPSPSCLACSPVPLPARLSTYSRVPREPCPTGRQQISISPPLPLPAAAPHRDPTRLSKRHIPSRREPSHYTPICTRTLPPSRPSL
ncbi:hypothetical protein BD413DRAFT_595249, partial [Trametes elegans]